MRAVEIRKRLRQSQWIAEAAIASWLAFIAEGCFEFNFGTSPVLMMFLFIVASPFAAERLEDRESERAAEIIERAVLRP